MGKWVWFWLLGVVAFGLIGGVGWSEEGSARSGDVLQPVGFLVTRMVAGEKQSLLQLYGLFYDRLPQNWQQLKGEGWLLYDLPLPEERYELKSPDEAWLFARVINYDGSEFSFQGGATTLSRRYQDWVSQQGARKVHRPDVFVCYPWEYRTESGMDEREWEAFGRFYSMAHQIRFAYNLYFMTEGPRWPVSWPEVRDFLIRNGFEVYEGELSDPWGREPLTIGEGPENVVQLTFHSNRLEIRWRDMPEGSRVPACMDYVVNWLEPLSPVYRY